MDRDRYASRDQYELTTWEWSGTWFVIMWCDWTEFIWAVGPPVQFLFNRWRNCRQIAVVKDINLILQCRTIAILICNSREIDNAFYAYVIGDFPHVTYSEYYFHFDTECSRWIICLTCRLSKKFSKHCLKSDCRFRFVPRKRFEENYLNSNMYDKSLTFFFLYYYRTVLRN